MLGGGCPGNFSHPMGAGEFVAMRRKIKDAGAVATLTDWAMKPKETSGFVALVGGCRPVS